MVFFEDFGKTVRDLFKLEHYEANLVSLTCITENSKLSTECLFPGGSKIIVEDKRYGTAEFADRKGKSLELKSLSLMDNFKVKLGARKSEEALTTEYENGELAARCKLELNTSSRRSNEVSFTGQLAKEVHGLWLGGKMKYSSVKGWEEYKAGMHYENDDNKLSFKTDFNELQVQLWKKISSKVSLAANYDLDLNSYGLLVSFGGLWKVDEQCSTQGFIQSKGDTCLSYKQKLSDRLSVSIGTSFILHNILSNVNVSYKLEFEA